MFNFSWLIPKPTGAAACSSMCIEDVEFAVGSAHPVPEPAEAIAFVVRSPFSVRRRLPDSMPEFAPASQPGAGSPQAGSAGPEGLCGG